AAADHSEVDLGSIAGVSDIGSRHHHNEDAMGLAVGAGGTAAVVCDGVSSSNRPDTAATAAAIAATRVFANRLAQTGHTQPAQSTAAPSKSDAASTDGRTDSAGSANSADSADSVDSASSAPTADAMPAANARAAAPSEIGSTATHEVQPSASVTLLLDAGDAAQTAARLAGSQDSSPNPPSTTFVAAVVTPADVTVGWVGDSRAYWLPDPGTDGEPLCLTVDDTLAGQLAAVGVAIATDSPNAGALIRWMGFDAHDTEPHTTTYVPPGPGRVIVCSDGLYRYASEPDELAAVTPAGRPIDVASALVRLALDAGGQDNVTVVVLPYSPELSAT
ncbi:MAG TPA: protein phosphatase 2C domain-containing protein, partial [Micromonosporaceae bacterium]